MGGTVFGMASVIVAGPAEVISLLPTLAEASATFRGVNVVLDYGTQVMGNYISGDRNFKDAGYNHINVGSLGLSALNPVGGIKSLAFNSVTASAFSLTPKGYDGLGGGKSLETVGKESFVSLVAGSLSLGASSRVNQLQGRLNHVNTLGGSNSALSKSIQSTITKTETVGTTIGLSSGTVGNVVNNKKDN